MCGVVRTPSVNFVEDNLTDRYIASSSTNIPKGFLMKQAVNLAISVFILVGSAAFAATNEVVVTATRMAEQARDVPASVTIIGGARLAGAAAVNADELLRTAGGISVMRNYGVGSGIPGQVNVRGIPGLHGLLMLSDGYRLNEAATGFLSPNEIPLMALDRIEVVRGPFSALYGADAFSGVVNMILKEPGAGKGMVGSVGVGNDGLLDLALASSGFLGNCAYFAAVQRVQMDNVLAQDEITESVFNPAAGGYVDIVKSAENFDYFDNRVIAKTATDLGDAGHVEFQVRFFESELGMGQEDMRPLYPELVDSQSATRSLFAGVEYGRALSENVDLKTRLGYRDQQREVWGLDLAGYAGAVPLFAKSYSKTDADDVELELSLQIERTRDHIISVGADARRISADFGGLKDADTGIQFASSQTDSEAVENYGLFVQDSLTLGAVRLVSGIRLDSHSDFGEAVSPKIGFVWDASDTVVVRLAGGRAFRAPSLLELHQPSVGYGSITFVSNPDLEPEYVNSVDLGVTLSPAKNVKIDATLFRNDMEDLITPQIDGQIYTYRNTSKAWSQGVELEMSVKPSSGLELYAAGTLQESKDKTADSKLQHIPEEMASAGARYSLDLGCCVAEASIDGVFVGDRSYVDDATGMWLELQSYFRMDASVSLTHADRYRIGISAMNLMDEEYQESPVVNHAPGRVVAVRLGVDW